jgi:hypothetical protein
MDKVELKDIHASSRSTPGILAGRKQRRAIRRIGTAILFVFAIIVGAAAGRDGGIGGIIISIGRSLAGLGAFALGGLMLGVVLTAGAVFLYNGVLGGAVSLVDVDYIDEIPLVFAALGGILGAILARGWPDLVGLFGWGLIALVGNELIFRRPDSETPR